MKIYFKWLNEWKIVNENDKINDINSNEFIEQLEKSNDTDYMSIVKITTGNFEYFIRKHDIVWGKKLTIIEKKEDELPPELQSDDNDEINFW